MSISLRCHSCESGNPALLIAARKRKRLDSRFRGNDRDNEQGFTLVELMVVIVIIGLLATIVVINVLPAIDKGNAAKAKADVSILEQATEMYRLDNLAYPATTDGLQALVSPPLSLAQPQRYRQGGYIKRLPNDPWGRAYLYSAPGRNGPFDIYSLGADGQEGGEGENADIGSWQ